MNHLTKKLITSLLTIKLTNKKNVQKSYVKINEDFINHKGLFTEEQNVYLKSNSRQKKIKKFDRRFENRKSTKQNDFNAK